MSPPGRRDSGYLPGRLYDLAFGGLLRGVREYVAAGVGAADLYPWLDICCGTGSQFRRLDPGLGPGLAFGLDLSLGMVRYAAARAPGRAFVCGDAARLPFKAGVFRSVSVSFGLHDKDPAVRRAMMVEVRRVLGEGGRLLAVDFENPWSFPSRIGALLTRAVEGIAGGEHDRNGREFLRRGGLRAFLRENGFVEISRRGIPLASAGVVASRIEDQGPIRPEGKA